MGKKWKRTVLVLMMAAMMAGSAFVVPAFADDFDGIIPYSDKQTTYTSAEAINTAINNSASAITIVLGQSIDGNILVPKDKNVTLDLNGYEITHNISSTDPTPYGIENLGTLKIVDNGTTKGKIISKAASVSCICNNILAGESTGGNLTLEGITVESCFVSVKNENDSTLTMNGCNISTTYAKADTGALMNWGTAIVSNSSFDGGQYSVGVYAASGATGGKDSDITLTDCHLDGYYAVYAKRSAASSKDDKTKAYVTINGGYIESVSTMGVNPVKNKSKLTITGNVESNSNALSTVLDYTESGTNVTLTDDITTTGEIEVKEGVTLTIPENVTYKIGSGSRLILNGTLEGSIANATAYKEANKRYYGSLKDAIDNSSTNDTVKLLKDTKESITMTTTTNKTVLVDVNGKKLDGSISITGPTIKIEDTATEQGLVSATFKENGKGNILVLSGNYANDPTNYLDPSVQATKTKDGTTTVYQEINEALKDADPGDTIVAHKDVTVDVYGSNVTIVPAKTGITVNTAPPADGYEVTKKDDGSIIVNPKATYPVTVDGKVLENAYQGKKVTITALAKDGYTFTSWTVVSGNVTLADATAATTTFIMPGEAVEINANYTAVPQSVPATPLYPATPTYPVAPTYPTYDTGSTAVSKKDGWTDLSAGSVYYKNGIKVKGWQEIDGETYYFDKKGYLQTGWLELEDGWYYLDPIDGAQQTGWEKVGNTWYYLDQKTGVMYAGGMKTIDGETYYFYDWGGMASSWWYLDEGTGAWYFFRGNGAMAKSSWIEWKGVYYYCGADGKMLVNTVTPDGYKVDGNGAWIK